MFDKINLHLISAFVFVLAAVVGGVKCVNTHELEPVDRVSDINSDTDQDVDTDTDSEVNTDFDDDIDSDTSDTESDSNMDSNSDEDMGSDLDGGFGSDGSVDCGGMDQPCCDTQPYCENAEFICADETPIGGSRNCREQCVPKECTTFEGITVVGCYHVKAGADACFGGHGTAKKPCPCDLGECCISFNSKDFYCYAIGCDSRSTCNYGKWCAPLSGDSAAGGCLPY
ncbi:MAG: hypothetical protein GY847_19400 [Proteobacteria bacterium]|nr:hypothetical protein [Pseudomonadota bacterium]